MKKQVKCLDPDCGKMFWSPVRQIWIGMARDKKETYKTRLLGGSKRREDVEKMEITENENLEIQKVLTPNEQFCLHCRMRHQKLANLQRNRDKMIAKMRAQQLGEDPKKVSIRVVPEDEARAFDRFTVMRKIAIDRQKAEQKAKEAVFKTDPQAVQAAFKKLEEIKKEREKDANTVDGKEEKSKEN